MADISLPGLTPDNPRNHLSDSARRRISDAYLEGEKIRWRALAGVEARYRSESDPEDAFFEYCEKGHAALEINQANLESARLILSALLREYRAAGKSGWEIRQIMDDELDGLASSAELTAIERRMVGLELDLYRMTPTEDLLPDAIRERVRAGLLRIHSKRLERAKLLDCLRDVYDLYASELAKGGEPLTDSLLMDSIPVWVFRAAVDQKWIPYPLIRPITGVVESLLEGWYNPSHYEVVPHKELPETFGGCKVTKGYAAWFTRNLDSRIEYWRSAAKPRAEAGGRRQPEQTGDMVPKPDAEAPAPLDNGADGSIVRTPTVSDIRVALDENKRKLAVRLRCKMEKCSIKALREEAFQSHRAEEKTKITAFNRWQASRSDTPAWAEPLIVTRLLR